MITTYKNENISFESERLIINAIDINDGPFILQLVNTPGWIQFIGNRNINSEQEAENYIKSIIENLHAHYWVVRLRSSKIPIGIVTFIKKEYLDNPDIGFAFLPEHGKMGYALEATLSVLYHIAKTADISTISAVTIPENKKSITLLKKMGFTYSHDLHANGELLNVYEISTDLILLNKLCSTFFQVFDNVNEKKLRLEELETLCVPEIRIYSKHDEKYICNDLQTFIQSRKEILTDGRLIDFSEQEISSKTVISANIAQRYSEYEKTGRLNTKHFIQRGIKLFQFVKNNNDWKICSIIWEDES